MLVIGWVEVKTSKEILRAREKSWWLRVLHHSLSTYVLVLLAGLLVYIPEAGGRNKSDGSCITVEGPATTSF